LKCGHYIGLIKSYHSQIIESKFSTEISHYRMKTIVKPLKDMKWSIPLDSITPINKGQVFAKCNKKECKSPLNGYIVMPTLDINCKDDDAGFFCVKVV
jgi:hypothetical protein